MSDTISNQPILIIGAGLGGLALAHALKSHNIPFQLFERDDSPSFRAQGYRIRIQDYYLKQLLPPELFATFEHCCGEVKPGFLRVDALTGDAITLGGPGGPSSGQPRKKPQPIMTEGKTVNADRMVLRDLMMKPMVEAGLVNFGKRFSSYELVKEGVVARFHDGTEYKGCLLVGADGSRSAVRKQMLPRFRLLDTEGRAVFGKTPITENLFDDVPKEVGGGLCVVADDANPEQRINLFCDVMRFVNRSKTDVDLPKDYIYWVLSLKTDRTGMSDEKFFQLSKDESITASLKWTEKWAESCREIIKRQLPDGTSTLAFATSHPDFHDWGADTRITLMGDAAHPMTPVGGVGANAAFQDATLLLRALLNGAKVEDIAEYEDTMRRIARGYIAKSAEGAGNLFGMKPIEELKPWTLWA